MKRIAFVLIACLLLAACTSVERAAYDTIVGSKAFLDSIKTQHPECMLAGSGTTAIPATANSTPVCTLLSKATSAKDALIDVAEVYCSSPSFQNGGACTPPMKGTPAAQQLSSKLQAAITGYQQAEKDLKGVIHGNTSN